MSGLNTPISGSGPISFPGPPPVPPPPPAPASQPGVARDQLTLSAQPTGGNAAPAAAAPVDLGPVKRTIYSGDQIAATLAVSQLEAYAATNRQEVVDTLKGLLGPGGNEVLTLTAIQVLGRLKATEAAQALQQLANTSYLPISVRQAAGEAYRGMAPQAPAAPGAPSAPGMPPAPAGPQAAPASTPPEMADMLVQLMNDATAPGAIVTLSRMPSDQMLPVVQRFLRDFQASPQTMELMATMLAKRVKEPAAAHVLAAIMDKNEARYRAASTKAALALLSTKSPTFMPGIMRFMLQRDGAVAPVKRAMVDTIARHPHLLATPKLPVVLKAMLHQGETPELVAAASHALAGIKTAEARDILAGSPLLRSDLPDKAMRGMIDLGAHPGPYPPQAVQQLQRLAQHKIKQVSDQAKALLGQGGK